MTSENPGHGRVIAFNGLKAGAFLIVAGLVLCIGGCHQKKTTSDDDHEEMAKIRPQLEALSEQYFKGSPGQARAALVKTIHLIEGSRFSAFAKGSLAWIECGRLYLLDKRLGDPVFAEADFVKARYWHLRWDEESNMSEIDAAKGVAEFTPLKCEELVMSYDRGRTGGKGPAYVASIPLTTSPASRPGAPQGVD